MTRIVKITDVKANFAEIINSAAAGEDIITVRGKQLARLAAFGEPTGSLKEASGELLKQQ